MGSGSGSWRQFFAGWPSAAAWVLVLVVPGCFRGGGPDRIAVQGAVQMGGHPVAAGSISLLPDQGRRGPAATTSIVQGRFQFTKETGPDPGPHRVIVQLSVPDKASVLAGAGRRPGPGARPAKTRWEFHVQVPGRGPFQYDVKLE
jgi:hypothetical protein